MSNRSPSPPHTRARAAEQQAREVAEAKEREEQQQRPQQPQPSAQLPQPSAERPRSGPPSPSPPTEQEGMQQLQQFLSSIQMTEEHQVQAAQVLTRMQEASEQAHLQRLAAVRQAQLDARESSLQSHHQYQLLEADLHRQIDILRETIDSDLLAAFDAARSDDERRSLVKASERLRSERLRASRLQQQISVSTPATPAASTRAQQQQVAQTPAPFGAATVAAAPLSAGAGYGQIARQQRQYGLRLGDVGATTPMAAYAASRLQQPAAGEHAVRLAAQFDAAAGSRHPQPQQPQPQPNAPSSAPGGGSGGSQPAGGGAGGAGGGAGGGSIDLHALAQTPLGQLLDLARLAGLSGSGGGNKMPSVSDAYKAPKFKPNSMTFGIWLPAFINFVRMADPRIEDLLEHGPMHNILPVSQSELNLRNESFVSSGTPVGGVETPASRQEMHLLQWCTLAIQSALAEHRVAQGVIAPVPAPNAPKMMINLAGFFQRADAASIMMEMQQFNNISQIKGEKTEDYYVRVEAKASRLGMLGRSPGEVEKIQRFLFGYTRNDDLGRIVMAQAGGMDCLATAATTLVNLERQEEAHRAVKSLSQSAQQKGGPHSRAFMTEVEANSFEANAAKAGGKERKRGKPCFNCGKAGHFSRDCRSTVDSKGQPTKTCTSCGNKGHLADECRKSQQQQPQSEQKQEPSNKPKKAKKGKGDGASSASSSGSFTPFVARSSLAEVASAQAHGAFADEQQQSDALVADTSARSGDEAPGVIVGILDSGCTDIMFDSSVPLHQVQLAPVKSITTASAERLHAPTTGVAAFRKDDGSPFTVTALQHPGLARNLFGVAALLNNMPDAERVVFTRADARVLTKDGAVLLSAQQQRGLYHLVLRTAAEEKEDAHAVASAATHAADSPQAALDLHRRLGHIGQTKTKTLLARGILLGSKLSVSDLLRMPRCDGCALAKSTRLPFSKPLPFAFEAEQPLEIVHADLHGPVTPESLGGHRYVLVLVDRYSSFIWVALLEEKSQAAGAVQRWEAVVKKQFKRSPTRFITDRGTEFLNSALQQFFAARGIQHSATAAYSPQTNGKAERANRSLMEGTRAALITAGASPHWWAEGLLHFAEVFNLVNTNTADGLTAYSSLIGKDRKVNVDSLRPWGETAYVHIPAALQQGKYGPRAVKMAFVGESLLSPGARRFVSAATGDQIVESRDAEFLPGDFSAMHELRQSEIAGGLPVQESDPAYFERTALENEIKLARLISLQQGEQPPPPPPPSAGGRPRRSAASTRPPQRLGMVAPGDIGSASMARVKLGAAPGDPALAPARAAAAEDRAEAQRQADLIAAESNQPFPADRASCNRSGEIITESKQCVALTKRGARCKKRTRDSAWCHAHRKTELGLYIHRSSVPGAGRGLFSAIDRPAGSKIGPYTGDLTLDSKNVDFTGSSYIFELSSAKAIDAARKDSFPTRLINDPRGSGRSPNCEFRADTRRNQVTVYTTKPVKAKEELFVSYGPAYWGQHERLHGKLKVKKVQTAKKTGVPEPSKRKLKRAARKEEAARFAAACAAAQIAHTLGTPTAITSQPLPRSLAEVRKSAHRVQWEEAIGKELDSWRKMDVYAIEPALPQGERLHDAKGVFKIKLDANGTPTKFKFRIVARGFTQIFGVDYLGSYAPTMDADSLRTLCALCTAYDLELGCADVETAYLHADLDRPVYILAPEFFQLPAGTILRLKKAVYGLKQSARLWNAHLTAKLEGIGFRSLTNSDPCIFVRQTGEERPIFVGVFVDDMVYAYDRRDAELMRRLMQELGAQVTLKDLGPASSVLGISIQRDRTRGILQLCQPNYAKEVAAQYGYDGSGRPVTTPESASLKFSDVVDADSHFRPSTHGEAITLDIIPRVLGQLTYLGTCTRPDIARAVNRAAQDQAQPTQSTIARIRNILAYLGQHTNLPIVYSASQRALRLHAFSDASFAAEADRKSVTGVVAKLSGAAISWTSKRQPTIARSGSEAEYIAADEGGRELASLRNFLSALTLAQPDPSPLYLDSTVAVNMSQGEGSHKRRRHIDIKHHLIREQVELGILRILWVPTAEQQADILTKPLPGSSFAHLRGLIMGHAFSPYPA